MKKILYFVRDDGYRFYPNGDGTYSSPENIEAQPTTFYRYTAERLLQDRPVIQPVYEPCACRFCTDTHPRINAIMAALPTQALKDSFESLMEEMEAAKLDLEVAEARLAGDWPGSEWIKEAKRTS
jgi:hypothetical protein